MQKSPGNLTRLLAYAGGHKKLTQKNTPHTPQTTLKTNAP